MGNEFSSRIWLTGFWGFQPEDDGHLGFTAKNDRTRLFSTIESKQLICIYGTNSPETENKLKNQLLGMLEVERTEIDSWEKMSPASQKRNSELGREDKWRYAMPVRRAWRTNKQIDIRNVFSSSYDPKNGRNIAKYGTWLSEKEAGLIRYKFPFYEVDVFGEPSVSNSETVEEKTGHLKPSKGIFGGFGERISNVNDRVTFLYLAKIHEGADLVAGERIPFKHSLFKIGISGNLKQRRSALNLSFPQNSKISWEIERENEFPCRKDAGDAEQSFKDLAILKYEAKSLGREFFIIQNDKAEALFNSLSTAKELHLSV